MLGVFNAINVTWAPPLGYPDVPHGSSFVQAVSFTDDASCPVDVATILTYSQSSDPTSSYYKDQTEMFSGKEWVSAAFCEEQIAADPSLQTTNLHE